MNDGLDSFGWPIEQIQQAVTALAQHQAWRCDAIPASAVKSIQELTTEQQIASFTELAGLKSKHIYAPLSESTTLLPATAPALLLSPKDVIQQQLYIIVRSTGKHAYLLAPDLKTYKVLLSQVVSSIKPNLESNPIDELLAQLPEKRRQKAHSVLSQQESKQKLEVWCIQAASLPWHLQLKQNGALKTLFTIFTAYATQYGLLLCAWWVIGYSTLRGQFDSGWFWLWVLLLATLPILRMSVINNQGKFAISLGMLIKRRLLANALEQNPETVFTQGTGHILGRVFESDRLHSLALNSAFMTLLAVFEFIVAGIIISLGSGGAFAVGLWAIWLAFTLFCSWTLYQRRKRWTQKRLDNTQQLIEKMQGHRTRLIQESPNLQHHGEDADLTAYLNLSKHMDQASVRLQAAIPRAWLLFGCIGLAPSLLALTQPQTITLAIGLGGVLLAYQALQRLVMGITELISAAIAYNSIKSHLSLSEKKAKTFPPNPAGNNAKAEPLLKAVALNYAYNKTSEPVLKHCNIAINHGDQILLSGASGSGKSTLAALLAGLKQPQSGLLTLKGLDLPTLSHQGWRLSVASAPQFHQNHVLANTFIFNLLMGREWPPQRQDVAEAEKICHELGLSPLLERMPAGILQTVGETGWQLSHGERSRLYIARALLQGAELIILDESFAALDPESLQLAMMCVMKRATTLLVIAHA